MKSIKGSSLTKYLKNPMNKNAFGINLLPTDFDKGQNPRADKIKILKYVHKLIQVSFKYHDIDYTKLDHQDNDP